MKRPFSYIFLASLLFAATTQITLAVAQPGKPQAIVAEVNGNKLTIADFQAYIQMRLGNKQRPQELNQAQRQVAFGRHAFADDVGFAQATAIIPTLRCTAP